MSEIRANTISAANGTDPVTLTSQYAAKVWTHFDADATIAGSFNSSSITDTDVGRFDVNFTNNMSDNAYAASMLTQNNTDVGYNGINEDHIGLYIRLLSSQAAYDRDSNQLIVVGDLA